MLIAVLQVNGMLKAHSLPLIHEGIKQETLKSLLTKCKILTRYLDNTACQMTVLYD